MLLSTLDTVARNRTKGSILKRKISNTRLIVRRDANGNEKPEEVSMDQFTWRRSLRHNYIHSETTGSKDNVEKLKSDLEILDRADGRYNDPTQEQANAEYDRDCNLAAVYSRMGN